MCVYREGLGEEVSEIVRSLAPKNFELLLRDPIANPVKSHVNCLSFAQLGGVVGDADRALVVTQQDGGRLGIA